MGGPVRACRIGLGERGLLGGEGELWVTRWPGRCRAGMVWSGGGRAGGRAGDAAAFEVPGGAGAAGLHQCGDLDGVVAGHAEPAPGSGAGEPVEQGAVQAVAGPCQLV